MEILRSIRMAHGVVQRAAVPMPPVTIFVHGSDRSSDNAFVASLHANTIQPAAVVFATAEEAAGKARELMELRGDRYLAFVDARCELREGWLDELARQVEYAPNTGAATYTPELPPGEDSVPYAAGARCTLLRLSEFPQHLRLETFATIDGAVADLTIRALDVRTGTRSASKVLGDVPPAAADEFFESRHGMPLAQALASGRDAIEAAFRRTPGRKAGLVSIVMLSWNAPQFTKLALESIEQFTTGDYEIVIVDNGSDPDTVEWLKTLGDRARVIYNAENRGFAGGNNQALAAARGEYIVLLNNDVIVTEGWLDGLLHAFDRIPGLGVSAPRSNKIAGDQIVVDASYADIAQMHVYANARRERYRDRGYMTDRAIGLCLCIDRRVIDEIGGIDERFGVGNFEDDDFCMRVRAAGYRIFVCDDVFIHHFGSQTFAANKIDWTATMRENWSKFAEKWGLPPKQENGGYIPAIAIRGGFDRRRHYVALPSPQNGERSAREYDAVFFAAVRGENDWDDTGAFVRRYLRAFAAERSVMLAIAAFGEPDALTIGERIKRLAQREGIDLDTCADIDVCDTNDERDWQSSFSAKRTLAVTELEERSPSALRRILQENIR
ncbi:MAG TPA: glycosyltransferase family 2 protein [Candidatus Baltobacteraceae bacterium]|nr:glycosyltransferase family 2 protein [Candidatus Baltobacteraceae bacterium]